ncbi:MAG: hypothetical protein ACREID_06395, partial [Planctomycetota bacterium]
LAMLEARLATVPAQKGADDGDHRSEAVAALRALARTAGDWSECYGEGFEVLAVSRVQRAVAHAVVTPDRVVAHAAFFWLHELWVDPSSNQPPTNPSPPGTGPGSPPNPPPPPPDEDRRPLFRGPGVTPNPRDDLRPGR